ncbi:adenosine receptor A2b-like [Anthonomus grandis grandis]|uniref:adenosine receptor A2b-like n=1 Tax=Anthonomus grandis grandis TaxID=2921223 RepID=UPI0021654695|nr:adenosine receptor A2b-like [Anthonomus grandis grandis]
MDDLLFNYSQLALIGTNHADFTADNFSEVNISRSVTRLTSPLTVTIVVLIVFLLSPMILIGNSLVLVSMYRFKRLRTPSNYLVMSLATSDLGVGMFLPVGFYLELNGANTFSGFHVCLFSYGIIITLCCVSVLVMVAIAVDRFTSLARPLRYNNLITHSAVERYIVIFWVYSSMVGFTPLAYAVFVESKSSSSPDWSFGDMVEKPVQLFMFCAVYGPCSLVLLVCYGYIYFVARGHARAIRSEQQQSIYRHQEHYTGAVGPPRYGLALAITAGLFIGLWMPFQVCMLIDVFLGTNILTSWVSIYLALPILSSSAFNPWTYGYRNAELRAGVRKVIDDILTSLGFTYRSHQISDRDQIPPSVAATAGEPATFINQVQKDGTFWKSEGDFLLVPIAKPESSGVLSSAESQKLFCSNPKILLPCETPRLMLKSSRSMVESLAMVRGSDVLVVKGHNFIKHGSSVL